MNHLENGGSRAFPYPPYGGGLTKREYFAAFALQGILAYGGDYPVRNAVSLADELIKELEKPR